MFFCFLFLSNSNDFRSVSTGSLNSWFFKDSWIIHFLSLIKTDIQRCFSGVIFNTATVEFRRNGIHVSTTNLLHQMLLSFSTVVYVRQELICYGNIFTVIFCVVGNIFSLLCFPRVCKCYVFIVCCGRKAHWIALHLLATYIWNDVWLC